MITIHLIFFLTVLILVQHTALFYSRLCHRSSTIAPHNNIISFYRFFSRTTAKPADTGKLASNRQNHINKVK